MATRSLKASVGSNPVCYFVLILVGNLCASDRVLLGQQPVGRLPAIDATFTDDDQYPLRLGSRPSVDPLPPTGSDFDLLPNHDLPGRSRPYAYEGLESADPDEWWTPPPPKLSSHKKGFFQKLSISATWLDGGRVNDMGITELEAYLTVALPLPTTDHPLLITPAFETRFLQGPLTPDLPGQVYSAYAQFIWVPKLSDRWSAILGIEPGAYGDFEDGDADAFRLLGRGLVRFQWIPDRLEVIAGVLYLDREDVRILPAGGVIWSPNDDVRYEIVFPKPKLAHRTHWNGRVEHWVYVSGEFGGDSWAVQRSNGMEDRLTLRDVRVMLGFERRRDGGAGAAIEVGYVFSRTIEYSSATPDVNLPGTFMLRGILNF